MGHLVTEHSNEDPAFPAKDYVYAGSRLVAEVKGSIPAGSGLVLIGPTGTIDNCAPGANFNFTWRRDPGAVTQYLLRIDGLVIQPPFDALMYCSSFLSGRPA